ncbi:MAG: hypothetical protein H5T64_04865 [Chloroflexi bacterium]|nr:hypothetical protein [Chloroflexota bacterium]
MGTNDLLNNIRRRITTETIIAFVLGLLIGLVVLGWWIFPVQWYNTDPSDLRPRHKITYLQMIADSYDITGDLDAARARIADLKGPTGTDAEILALLNQLAQAHLVAGNAAAGARVQKLSGALNLTAVSAPQPTATPGGPVPGSLGRTLGILVMVVLILLGLAILFTILQRREGERRTRMRAVRPMEEIEEAEELEPLGAEMPVRAREALGTFVAFYRYGDDNYDDSFDIEWNGEFLGDCGIAIAETIGTGTPRNVTAFKMLLFDKHGRKPEESTTLQKFLVSEYAFRDENIRARLGTRGEMVPVSKGKVIVLEAPALRLEAEVLDMEYRTGTPEPNSVFDRLQLQLTVTRAEEGAES